MKGKINRLKEIRIELDKITEDCFQDHYPSYISNGLSTALSIVNDNLKELRKYESKNKKESEDQVYIETLNGPEIRDNGKNYK